MRILVDTNVLLRSVQAEHPQHARAVEALRAHQAQGDELIVVTQNLVEFWAVATRPVGSNGLGLSHQEAATEIEDIVRSFDFREDTLGAFAIWFDLVARYGVSGRPTHDAHTVAAMINNGIGKILTFNGADFARYKEISVEAL